jgi:FtsZ-binding cell division protein ZapB
MASFIKIGFVWALTVFCFSFVAEEPSIKWREGHRLTWKDFRGTPDESVSAAAITASGITYEMDALLKNNKVMVNCKVEAFFYPKKSWYRERQVNETVLAHEQLHFDITELYARKLKKAIDATVFTENVKEEIRKLYEGINNELTAFQDTYDEETNYSRNREEQLRWQERIGKALIGMR